MPSFFVVILTLIECDSSLAAKWVNYENNWPWKLLDILIECDSYLVAGWVNNENNWPWKLLDILIECDP